MIMAVKDAHLKLVDIVAFANVDISNSKVDSQMR